jgi:hypothetical protein
MAMSLPVGMGIIVPAPPRKTSTTKREGNNRPKITAEEKHPSTEKQNEGQPLPASRTPTHGDLGTVTQGGLSQSRRDRRS